MCKYKSMESIGRKFPICQCERGEPVCEDDKGVPEILTGYHRPPAGYIDMREIACANVSPESGLACCWNMRHFRGRFGLKRFFTFFRDG